MGRGLLGRAFRPPRQESLSSVSANITTRSVPEAGSPMPKAATPFLRNREFANGFFYFMGAIC